MKKQCLAQARVLAGVLLLAASFGANYLNAQATGAISGTVTDASGAAIPEAQVQVKNNGTGATQNIVSDVQGRYRVPELIIGDYDVQASKMGFATVVRTGITLTVGAQPVVDFQLAVGQQTQTVTVQAEVSQVETQSTAVGALVESKQISDLPLNGRNFTQLITLAPGVTQIPQGSPGAGSTFYGNGQKYSIAGSRPSGQAYLLDDQDMTNFWNNGPGAGGLGTALGVEAIAEFQTLTNTYSSQYGGNGAVINASTKSGTNAFHGSAFEFLRNDKLEARNFYDGSTVPPFRQNQFGGSLGGSIIKDKLFFFTSYEGLRNHRDTTTLLTVPDTCAHQWLASTATNGVCGAPIAKNANPQIAQAIANTMALYPLPFNEILTATGAASGTGNAFAINPNIGRENYFVGRIDYTINDRSSLFVRYVLDRAERQFTGPSAANQSAAVPYWPELDTTRDHFVSIEERHIITPRLVNLAHAGFSRTWEDAFISGSPIVENGVASAGAPGSSGVHPLSFFGNNSGRQDGVVQSFSGVTQIGATTTLPFYLVPNKFQYGDDVVWTSGAHNVRAGVNVTVMRENTWAPFQVGGQYTFANLAGFLAGTPSQVTGQLSDQQFPQADAAKDYRYTVFGLYFDDQWKLTNKLTVNIGLRYSPTTRIQNVRHQEYQLKDVPNGNWELENYSTRDNPSLRNWDPRLGLAWDPFNDHKTSIRASFGMFHNVVFSRDLNHWLQPPFLTATQTAAQGVQYQGTCSTLCSPFTNVTITPGVIPTNGIVNPPNSNYWYVNNTPYQMQWNLNIQREIMANTVATIAYIGSHNVNMFTQLDFNPPSSSIVNGRQTFALPRLSTKYGALVFANTVASSRYHGLQMSLNRRFSANWQTQISYTFSKSMDNSSGTYGLDGAGMNNNGTNPTYLDGDWGLSNFNRKHNFRVSGIYRMPFNLQGIAGQLVNGWQVSSVFTYLTGSPFSPLSANNRVFTGSGSSIGRVDVAPGACDLYANQSLSQWYNPSCFSIQPAGTYGNAGRNFIIGPNLWNLDTSAVKDWKVARLSDAFAVQFRAEAFNVLNHPNFQNPNNTIFAGTAPNPSAGRITATNSLPRIFQLALKVTF